MDHPLIDLISQKIAEAEKDGAFDNLPGSGKPLDLTHDPKDALVHRAMREGGIKAPIVAMRAEITEIKRRLSELTDEAARKAEMQKLADLQTRLALELEALAKYG